MELLHTEMTFTEGSAHRFERVEAEACFNCRLTHEEVKDSHVHDI